MELTDQAAAVEPKRAISRGMVSLYKKYVGRGPTDARTYLSDDLVVVVLRDTMTTAEKTLAESGKQELVLECRRGFQQTMRDEGVVGHYVDSVLSPDRHVLGNNKGELQYVYALFENGGNPTLVSGVAPKPPSNLRAE